MNKTSIIGIIIGIIIIGLGVYLFTRDTAPVETQTPAVATTTAVTATSTVSVDKTKTVLGTSVQNRDITAYHFGSGTKEVLFIGGIHGGYAWNTALLGYELVNYFKANESSIPANVKVTVIPVLNPDGLVKVTGTSSMFAASQVSSSAETKIAGRFNANNVDLNRNFDCDWKSQGKWQDRTVSGGSAAFSEPEAQAIRNYVSSHTPVAVVGYFSAANGVFAASCGGTVSAATRTLMNTYAQASGYKAFEDYNFYEVNGDMMNWFAKNNIPAVSVLLSDHQNTEWTKNKAGIDAVVKAYAN